ncbi:hypothetical protein PHYPSEUDO_009833 [Phytophthora pseudosyringae]|uniref:M96 mating-specific protein family n=1 Tax=Phytophthora pseudosyringae TaxID=221518 RepID=A0A8T1W6T1_9STRA|nr:hypothetical protein PHYPSEUDO_009833 [Phytophthora pseudosyringae]
MDVLVADDDNLVSLEEALAFIDNCDINDYSLTDTLLGAVPEQFSQTTPSDQLPPTAPAPPTARKRAKPQRKLSESSSSQGEDSTKKRRTRSAASSSTRLQQRKRAEIQGLREQAQELETQVELLKKTRFPPGDAVLELDAQLSASDDGALVAKAHAPNWHELAIAQYKERLVSEKTNRRLKSILSNQEKVNGALSGLLQKRSVLQGMEYVLSTKPPLDAPLLSSDDSGDAPSCGVTKKTLAELKQVAQRMHKQAKANKCKPSPAVSCDMRIKHDARRGKLIEFVTTTPMSCSVEDATELVWKEFTTHHDFFPDRVYKGMRCDKPNTQAKNFVMSLRSPSGLLELDGVQYIQKFEALDKTIFALAEWMFLPTKSLQFQDECWMTVTPLGSNASVVEIFLQLYMERDDGVVASPQGLTHAQNIVMGSLSNTLRKICQAQQNTLMEKAGHIIAAPSSGIV